MAKNTTTAAQAAMTAEQTLGQFAHTFTHKTMGEVGVADLNLDRLPAATLRFALTFGLRTILQNTYAGITEASEAQGLFAKKLDALLAGNVSTTRTVSTDALGKEIKRLAEQQVKAALKAKGVALNKIEPAKLRLAIDAFATAHDARLRAEATENLNRMAQLDVGEDLDIDALLGDIAGPTEG